MVRSLVLVALGLSLLPACGRRDQPDVRQVSLSPGDDSRQATALDAPQADEAVCPGSGGAHRNRPKRAAGPQGRLADAAPSRPADGLHSKLAGASRPKSSEVELPKTDARRPAKSFGTTGPKAAGRSPADTDSREVRIGDMCLVAPKTWNREPPSVGFLLAQFRLSRAQGDSTDAQLTVAPGASDKRSLERLREQLKEKPAEGSVEHLQIAGHEVVVVESSGADSPEDGDDAGDAAEPPAGEGRYRVLNAMVFVGGKVYFVNCMGPERTVGERAGEFRAFLETMKAVD